MHVILPSFPKSPHPFLFLLCPFFHLVHPHPPFTFCLLQAPTFLLSGESINFFKVYLWHTGALWSLTSSLTQIDFTLKSAEYKSQTLHLLPAMSQSPSFSLTSHFVSPSLPFTSTPSLKRM